MLIMNSLGGGFGAGMDRVGAVRKENGEVRGSYSQCSCKFITFNSLVKIKNNAFIPSHPH